MHLDLQLGLPDLYYNSSTQYYPYEIQTDTLQIQIPVLHKYNLIEDLYFQMVSADYIKETCL